MSKPRPGERLPLRLEKRYLRVLRFPIFSCLTNLVCPLIVTVNLILRIAATPAACSIDECVLWAFFVDR